MDARVQDYLDDKLQSLNDFETLDALLDSVQNSQALLRQQLETARNDHSNLQQSITNHTNATQDKAAAFQQDQHGIDERLIEVTNSDTSDEAVSKFETSMNKLKSLDIMTGYVEVLLEANGLVEECRTSQKTRNEAALIPYFQLRQMAADMGPLHQAAEEAAPHLLDHLKAQQALLLSELRESYSQDLETTLKSLQWPKLSKTIPIALETEWSRNISRLLQLQRPDLETHNHENPLPLYPLLVMIGPLQQRFEYHFSGNKETNRLDKPEYFLNNIIELIDGYADFLTTTVQPILLQQFRGTALATIPAYVDAISAFITAILPVVQRKLVGVASQAKDQPNLLSHLVQEVMKFDATLQDGFAYAPSTPSALWPGLSHYLFTTGSTYDDWLSAERDFALTRYQAIIDDPRAGELDYDSVAADATKPSQAAIRVNDLLETITERYKPLSSFSQKLRFLIDIQIAIFDMYYNRLNQAVEAYMTMTSSVARTVHGISKEEQRKLQGVEGLDRLCRIFGSADYLERAMRDWSDDLFFIELYDELQSRSQQDKISSKLGSIKDLQAKVSSAIGETGTSVEGALFDETADAYRRVRVRSEGLIVEVLTYNTREALKSFCKVNAWAALSTSTSSSLTAEIEPTLRLLTDYLTFLSKTLGRLPLRRVVRQLSYTIQATIWDQVILRHTFSAAGALQLKTDVDAIVSNISRYVGISFAQSSMRRLCDGLHLLSLPVKGEIERVKAGTDDDDAAWDDDGDGDVEMADGQLSLFAAERLVFKDNEHAREALEKLGLDSLSEADARHVLERRIELAS